MLRGLKQQAGAEVHFLTKKAFASIIENNSNVDKVFTLTADINEVIIDLKKEGYDAIIDLHHNLRSQRVKLALGKPSTSFSKLNAQKWLMVNFHVDRLPKLHIVDRYMETVAHLGVKQDGHGLDFSLPVESHVDIKSQFGIDPGTYCVIVIGAAHATKCMTAEQIRLLCHEINMPVILLGGKEESGKANEILSVVSAAQVKSAVGALSILQSASVIQQAGSIITHDTGMMHIAAALKKPQVVVWGNTIPQFGMYPYYGNMDVKWKSFEITNLRCRPCSKLGFEKCPKGHFKCMLEHNVKEIAMATMSLR